MTEDQTEDPQQSRLSEFEAVGRQLWPYVRYFAMAGACTDAIDAVVRLGRLLGEAEDGSQYVAEVAEEIRDETIKCVTNWLQEDQRVRAKVGARIAGEIAALLRDLAAEQGGGEIG